MTRWGLCMCVHCLAQMQHRLCSRQATRGCSKLLMRHWALLLPFKPACRKLATCNPQVTHKPHAPFTYLLSICLYFWLCRHVLVTHAGAGPPSRTDVAAGHCFSCPVTVATNGPLQHQAASDDWAFGEDCGVARQEQQPRVSPLGICSPYSPLQRHYCPLGRSSRAKPTMLTCWRLMRLPHPTCSKLSPSYSSQRATWGP